MRNKKIWIVVMSSRAATYGIGTYRANLIEYLKQSGIDFGVIELNSSVDEVSVEHKDGYEHIFLPSTYAESPKHTGYYSRNAAYLLRELIADDRERDLVFHINFMGDDILVKYLKKLFRCKIVLTVHYTNWSFDLLGDYRKLDGIMSKKKRLLDDSAKRIRTGFESDIKMVRRCDRVVYIAEHSANVFSKYMKQSHHVVVNNGLKDELKRLSASQIDAMRARYFIAPDTKMVLFAGRLDEVKGVKYLIKAFRQVLTVHRDARLVIAGDGAFSSLLQEAENLWPRIVFTGKVDKKKLYELYGIADIGIVSSLHEEFGYVAVEMLMHGLPIIAGDTGGLAEMIEEGVSGFKVPVRMRKEERRLDTKALASKINLLLGDRDLATKLGEGGRKRFLERYELSVFGDKMIALYNSI